MILFNLERKTFTMISLYMVKSGDLCRVQWILLEDSLIETLKNVGFVVDEMIRVLSNSGGNIVCTFSGKTIALDSSTAEKIKVCLTQ